MLIVNADDFGYDAPTTDAILMAHSAGLVSSATAMVFMADSERAMAAARERGLPIGLHLNLTEPFEGLAVPADLESTQRRLAQRVRPHLRARRWTYDPRLNRDVATSVGAQLKEFRQLRGADPTHLDGHLHVHACLNVLLSSALPRRLPMRRVVIDNHPAGAVVAALSGARQRLADRRFRSTDLFVSLRTLAEGHGADLIALAERKVVEVMVHPGTPAEKAFLEGDKWAGLSANRALGSYGDLT
jgi:chitin disaccharide deacetylase